MAMYQAATEHSRELQFDHRDIDGVRHFMCDYAGITLPLEEEDTIYSRLSRRLPTRGLGLFSDDLALLAANDEDKWEAFINGRTTHLTSIFSRTAWFPPAGQACEGLVADIAAAARHRA